MRSEPKSPTIIKVSLSGCLANYSVETIELRALWCQFTAACVVRVYISSCLGVSADNYNNVQLWVASHVSQHPATL